MRVEQSQFEQFTPTQPLQIKIKAVSGMNYFSNRKQVFRFKDEEETISIVIVLITKNQTLILDRFL
jgi:hypothetical protein